MHTETPGKAYQKQAGGQMAAPLLLPAHVQSLERVVPLAVVVAEPGMKLFPIDAPEASSKLGSVQAPQLPRQQCFRLP